MGIKVITPPTVEPITLSDAKAHLRVDGSDEDALITAAISAARQDCEQRLDRSIAPTTLALVLDAFPAGAIRLPRGPVTAVTSIVYRDTVGALQTLSAANYSLDDAQIDGWVLPAYDYDWPSTRDQANAVTITYTAGYASAPAIVRQWLLLRIGTLYQFREADADRVPQPSTFADRLLDGYRVSAL